MNNVPCPHCGGEITAEAAFCRHCGSSESDGWGDDSDPGYDDDFDYDDFVEQHFSTQVTNTTIAPIWRFVAVMLLISFVLWVFVLF